MTAPHPTPETFKQSPSSEELYFRRADLFTDSSEGPPPDQYARRVLALPIAFLVTPG
jgi:hypothetical protein